MVLSTQIENKLTLAEFLALPETKPASEYINHKVEQKSMPQGEHSTLQGSLVTAINQISIPKKLAYAFPELRCTFGGISIVPDISVFEWQNIPLRPNGRIVNKFEIPPDWIIEILSPDQSPSKIIRKITFCLQHGTKLGWFIDPEDESVIIFHPNCLPEVKSNTDILPVLDVLADWQLSATDLFTFLSFS
jgi:Uma2 family endonuclease